MLKKVKIKIKGIHCQSCKTLIETEVDVLPGVNKIEVDYLNESAQLEYDDQKITLEKISREITKLNYQIAFDNDDSKAAQPKIKINSFWLGILIPLGLFIIIGGYFMISKLGGFELLAKLNQGNIGYGLIFIIGLLAGFHCVGMCGGLVVAYSAADLQKETAKKSFTPHFQYNLGRLISYTIIGAILGGIGTFFAINPTFTGMAISIAGIFMVLMGASFIFNWQILQKIKLRTPQFIARFLYNQKHSKNPKGPLLVGLLNGFMPCGPLQAMQLYALTTGSIGKGALSMALYSIGTIPMMFGFGVFLSVISNQKIKQIIRISGVLVMILGFIMIGRGLTNFGYSFNFNKYPNQINTANLQNDNGNYQTVTMKLGYFGYEPNVLYIKKGIPVRWVIDATNMSGCTNAIMIEELGIRKDLQKGENIIEFTPQKTGELKFSCWMRMVWGKFIVSD